jgi:hypothetical protein
MHNSAIAPPAVIQPPLTMLQIVSKTDTCKNSTNNTQSYATLRESTHSKKSIET